MWVGNWPNMFLSLFFRPSIKTITWKSYLYPGYIAFERSFWSFLGGQQMSNTFKQKYSCAHTAFPHPVFVDMLWDCPKQANLSLNDRF